MQSVRPLVESEHRDFGHVWNRTMAADTGAAQRVRVRLAFIDLDDMLCSALDGSVRVLHYS